MKGPTEHLGASLLLVIPTSVQLGDTWILKTVASRFQVVRFVSISRIQMSLLLFMRDSLLWSWCSPVVVARQSDPRVSLVWQQEGDCMPAYTHNLLL